MAIYSLSTKVVFFPTNSKPDDLITVDTFRNKCINKEK